MAVVQVPQAEFVGYARLFEIVQGYVQLVEEERVPEDSGQLGSHVWR